MEINKSVINTFKKKPWQIFIAIGICLLIGEFIWTQLVLSINHRLYWAGDIDFWIDDWEDYVGTVIQIAGLLFCALGYGIRYVKRLDVQELIPHSRPELDSKLKNTLIEKPFYWGALPSASLSAFSIFGGMLVCLYSVIRPPKSGGGFSVVDFSGLVIAIQLLFGTILVIAGKMVLKSVSLSRSKIFSQAYNWSIINLIIAGAGTVLGLVLFPKIHIIDIYGDVNYLVVFVFVSIGALVSCCFCAGLSALLVWQKLGYRNGN